MKARRLLHLVGVVAASVLILTSFSATRYVLDHPGDSVQQNLASWARNKGLGRVVDALEARLHDTAPSTAPADSLALVTGDTTGPSATSTTLAATTTTVPNQPIDIAPRIQPELAGEGRWRSIATVRKKTVVWATSLRPLQDFGSVVATVALYNPRDVHAALFNGSELPGGGPWVNGKRITKAARPALIASFNGGFRFEHKPGGYFTEDTMVKKLKPGYATFAINNEGFGTVGVWGDDLKDDGQWVSVRQNLPPLVHKGEIVYEKYPWIDWGKDYDNKIYNFRSAVCVREDGNIMFVAVGDVNIGMLARTLIVIGCRTGMELDINGTWPLFTTWSGFGTMSRSGMKIDKRMGDPNRYIKGATKDFFVLFDPATLPPDVVR